MCLEQPLADDRRIGVPAQVAHEADGEPGPDDGDRRVPITAAEPSCLLTLRDEYLAVLPSDPRAAAVAAQPGCPRNCW